MIIVWASLGGKLFCLHFVLSFAFPIFVFSSSALCGLLLLLLLLFLFLLLNSHFRKLDEIIQNILSNILKSESTV